MILGIALNLLLVTLVMTLAVIHVKRERIEHPQYTVMDWILHFIGLALLGTVACITITVILLLCGLSGPIAMILRLLAYFLIGWNYPRYPYKKKGA